MQIKIQMQDASGYLPPPPILPQYILMQTRQQASECYWKKGKDEASVELSGPG